mmetsp:Transcript_85280/g.219627  ORF Transcript_85280/g.219627 Transcript_85280/m.219627 type:complete len:454 (-) Transcript_85280:129-1490(-)
MLVRSGPPHLILAAVHVPPAVPAPAAVTKLETVFLANAASVLVADEAFTLVPPSLDSCRRRWRQWRCCSRRSRRCQCRCSRRCQCRCSRRCQCSHQWWCWRCCGQRHCWRRCWRRCGDGCRCGRRHRLGRDVEICVRVREPLTLLCRAVAIVRVLAEHNGDWRGAIAGVEGLLLALLERDVLNKPLLPLTHLLRLRSPSLLQLPHLCNTLPLGHAVAILGHDDKLQCVGRQLRIPVEGQDVGALDGVARPLVVVIDALSDNGVGSAVELDGFPRKQACLYAVVGHPGREIIASDLHIYALGVRAEDIAVHLGVRVRLEGRLAGNLLSTATLLDDDVLRMYQCLEGWRLVDLDGILMVGLAQPACLWVLERYAGGLLVRSQQRLVQWHKHVNVGVGVVRHLLVINIDVRRVHQVVLCHIQPQPQHEALRARVLHVHLEVVAIFREGRLEAAPVA